jgi:nucleotide-binding universal stress UspA family protein
MNISSALMHGPIVVGTDFSALSNSILEYATKLALQESRPLHFVYVLPVIPEDSPDLLQIQEQELQRQVHLANQRLQGSGLNADGTIILGTPAHEILKASCIVVGTQDLSSVERMLLGSVSEAVIRKSNHPVIVVGPRAAAMAKETIPWKHLLLACDTDEGVTEAAHLAGDIAAGHHLRLTIFTVRSQHRAANSEGQFDALEQMMCRDAWLALKPQCLIREGEPAQEIIRMAQDAQADLLVMSAHSGSGLLTHLQSGILGKVLRNSRCPAMILRDLRAHQHLPTAHLADHPHVV